MCTDGEPGSVTYRVGTKLLCMQRALCSALQAGASKTRSRHKLRSLSADGKKHQNYCFGIYHPNSSHSQASNITCVPLSRAWIRTTRDWTHHDIRQAQQYCYWPCRTAFVQLTVLLFLRTPTTTHTQTHALHALILLKEITYAIL